MFLTVSAFQLGALICLSKFHTWRATEHNPDHVYKDQGRLFLNFSAS